MAVSYFALPTAVMKFYILKCAKKIVLTDLSFKNRPYNCKFSMLINNSIKLICCGGKTDTARARQLIFLITVFNFQSSLFRVLMLASLALCMTVETLNVSKVYN